MKKILIIRLSSFGDIVQTKALLKPLKEGLPGCEVSWLVRKDLEGTLKGDDLIDQVITFDRSEGLGGLIRLAFSLRNQFDIIYDAHNNTRSGILRKITCSFTRTNLVIRSKERWKRFLLFTFGINKFPQPYKAMVSYWKPLQSALKLEGELRPRPWPVALSEEMSATIRGRVVLVPSAAWPKKTWPLEHFKSLVTLLPEHQFLILGGPEDQFCEEIKEVAPERVENFAGQLSLAESCSVAAHADFIVTADTGLQQVADFSGVQGVSLMGPTAFGFTTMGGLRTFEVDLPCRPCSKDGSGPCSRKVYQECMVSLTPESVAKEIKEKMN